MVFKMLILWFGVLFITVSAHHESASCRRDKKENKQTSFQELLDAVNGDSLSFDDMQRLFSKLHFLNCNDSKSSPDYQKCFSPRDLYNLHGLSTAESLNSTEFTKICSPAIIYCLLPTPKKNNSPQQCLIPPKNSSGLFDWFAKNFSQHSEQGVTHEALDSILEEIKKTIGEHLSRTKCFSAESVIKEIGGEEDHHHEEDEEDHDHDEEDEEDHNEEENQILDQDSFEKACASIVLHLVQGFCIKEGHEHNETKTSLPSKESFIKDLFKEKEHLSEEDLEGIVGSLGIGKVSEAPTSSSTEDDHHDHQEHRRRRSDGSYELLPQHGLTASHRLHRREANDDHDHDRDDQANGTSDRCLSLDDMLTIFDVDHSVGADECAFKELCPAFIQQGMSGACKASDQKDDQVEVKHLHIGKIWGYGFVSVTIISLTSLVGVATMPFLGKTMYKKLLAALVALAVGSLSGDSLLHLLPHALGLHGHDSEDGAGHGHDEHEEDKEFVWKALVLMASIYVFFLFETIMHLGLKGKVGEGNGYSHVDVDYCFPDRLQRSVGTVPSLNIMTDPLE